MTFLVDVNILIALVDPGHAFHALASNWFIDVGRAGWATCPIVQNGAVRVFGHSRFPGGPGTTTAAAALFRPWFEEPAHIFWPDDISLLDHELIDPALLGAAARITDTYLLALAVRQGGKLATLDRRLSPAAVRGGGDALHVIA